MSNAIQSVLVENRVFPPPERAAQGAAIPSMDAYNALCAQVENDFDGFWAGQARDNLQWTKPFTQVLDESDAPFYRWFGDGELNVSANCLDVHLTNGNADKTAIIFESDDGKVNKVTYRDLQERIVDVGASLIITADEQVRGGKTIPLKPAVEEAIAMGGCEAVKKVVVYRRTGGKVQWNEGRDVWMQDVEAGQPDTCEPVPVNAEHPLFILYTSGSTGKPKGVQHSSAGYLLWALLTVKWTFDARKDDVYWCTADVGWVTGHTYITYGPLAAGLTQIVFEGVPTFPNAGRFWDMIARHKVTTFYTAPTAIRSLIKASEGTPDAHPKNFDLDSLRIIGTVGEPINPEAWMWYHKNVGRERCPIVDTWWQTETGGHLISPLPGVTPLVPGS